MFQESESGKKAINLVLKQRYVIFMIYANRFANYSKL